MLDFYLLLLIDIMFMKNIGMERILFILRFQKVMLVLMSVMIFRLSDQSEFILPSGMNFRYKKTHKIISPREKEKYYHHLEIV